MTRVRVVCEDGGPITPPFRYLDTMNAAIINALAATGTVDGEDLIGPSALPWTFALQGRFVEGRGRIVRGLTISTPNPKVGEALTKLDPAKIGKVSVNGDTIDCGRATVRKEDRGPHDGADELMIAFASPFAVAAPKNGRRSKTRYLESLEGVDLSAMVRRSASNRAGREIAVEAAVDPLTLSADGSPVWVRTRRVGGRDISIPAFSTAMTVRGRPEDVAFVYYAGIGAKTRGGFGCPVLTV